MDLTMQSEEIEAFMCPPAMGRTQKHGCVLLRWEVSKGDTIAHGRDQKHGCRHAMRTNSTNGNVCTVHGSKRVLSHVCGRTRRRWCGAQVRPTAEETHTWHGGDACCLPRFATCDERSVSWRSVHAGSRQERSQAQVRSQPTVGGSTTDRKRTTRRVGSCFVRPELHRTSAAQRTWKLRTARETTTRRWRGRKHDPTLSTRSRRRSRTTT